MRHDEGNVLKYQEYCEKRSVLPRNPMESAILLGHVDDPVFNLSVDTGSSHGLSLLGAIEFLRHQFPMPGQDGVRFDDGGDFLQGLFTELLANRSRRLALGIGKLHAPCNLVAQDTVL